MFAYNSIPNAILVSKINPSKLPNQKKPGVPDTVPCSYDYYYISKSVISPPRALASKRHKFRNAERQRLTHNADYLYQLSRNQKTHGVINDFATRLHTDSEKGPDLLMGVWEREVKPLSCEGKCPVLTSICEPSLKQLKKDEKVEHELEQAPQGSPCCPQKTVNVIFIEAKENRRKHSTCDSDANRHACLASFNKEDMFPKISHPSPERAPVASQRRKLLILDVNGLLADVIYPPPKECKADTNISRRAIFKRPFCDDFLKFCLERFDVGIWSSRTKKIIDRVADYLLGDMKNKLLFVWNLSDCTPTGFKTLENEHKDLVFKELRKLWENHESKLPWKKGYYNESNTLLLDDSPYKALLNPIHSAIFPYSYTFKDSTDSSLGPEGDIRIYLGNLAAAEDVQEYVREHAFGQMAIDKTDRHWGYYQRAIFNCTLQARKDLVCRSLI